MKTVLIRTTFIKMLSTKEILIQATIKKAVIALALALLLISCTNVPSNQLTINPQMALPQHDLTLKEISIAIHANDLRKDPALAKINRNSKLVTLTSSRDLHFLLQEALDKQMKARGYKIDQVNPSTELQVNLNALYANVQEGSFRYSITTKIDISLIATINTGAKYTKNYQITRETQGALNASNKKITQAIDQTLTDVIDNIARDNDVHQFIKLNTR